MTEQVATEQASPPPEEKSGKTQTFDQAAVTAMRAAAMYAIATQPEVRSVLVVFDYKEALNDADVNKALWVGENGPVTSLDAMFGMAANVTRAMHHVFARIDEKVLALHREAQTAGAAVVELRKSTKEIRTTTGKLVDEDPDSEPDSRPEEVSVLPACPSDWPERIYQEAWYVYDDDKDPRVQLASNGRFTSDEALISFGYEKEDNTSVNGWWRLRRIKLVEPVNEWPCKIWFYPDENVATAWYDHVSTPTRILGRNVTITDLTANGYTGVIDNDEPPYRQKWHRDGVPPAMWNRFIEHDPLTGDVFTTIGGKVRIAQDITTGDIIAAGYIQTSYENFWVRVRGKDE